jgi:hypothetical protein
MSPLLWKIEIGKWKLENKAASFQFLISVVGQFNVEAALRRHLVRRLTDKLAATPSN